MPATISAASASICLSTSHSETTSTGATWIRRSRSTLPYQPVPISPTRFLGSGHFGREAWEFRQRHPGKPGGAELQKFSAIHVMLLVELL